MARPKSIDVRRLAVELHQKRGHPAEYDGPCWGPTPADFAEARRHVEEDPQATSEVPSKGHTGSPHEPLWGVAGISGFRGAGFEKTVWGVGYAPGKGMGVFSNSRISLGRISDLSCT